MDGLYSNVSFPAHSGVPDDVSLSLVLARLLESVAVAAWHLCVFRSMERHPQPPSPPVDIRRFFDSYHSLEAARRQ